MLKAVNLEGRSFAKTNRAKMPGDRETALVGRLDCGSQLGAGYVHVGFEGGRAFVRPLLNTLSCFLGSRISVHVRPGDMHLGPNDPTIVNLILQPEISRRIDGPRGPNRGYASSEIEARKAEPHLAHRKARKAKKILDAPIKHVVVHTYESRNDAATCEVKFLSGAGYGSRQCATNGLNPAVGKN